MLFSDLAAEYDRIAAARGEERKERVTRLLRDAAGRSLRVVAHLTLGELVDPAYTDRLGIGPGTVRDVLAGLSGQEPDRIEARVRETGDLSRVAEELAGGKDRLTVAGLWARVERTVREDGDRAALLRYVFASTTPLGARYVVRMALNRMQIGVGEGMLNGALARAFGVDEAAVERALALTNSVGLTATHARRGAASLAQTGLALFRPYRFMNAQRAEGVGEALAAFSGEALFETKYDGARLQIHVRAGDPAEVRLFTRRLNDVTAALPDVVAAVQAAWRDDSAILEGEAVAFDPSLEHKQPFQAVLTRLGRIHDVEETAAALPLVLFLFDVVYQQGRSLLERPQRERTERLPALFRPSRRVQQTDARWFSDGRSAEGFFREAVGEGHEGLLVKDPDGPYVPGRRVRTWLKVKPAFETLDVVVVGGVWGTGRRKGRLSSLVVAVEHEGRPVAVGKVGTGFSEETLAALTDALAPTITATRGRTVEVEPTTVIEVDFQDVQKTDAYESGYALRIPRFRRQRPDKSAREADTLERLLALYGQR